ncbi:hypothetical protein [Kitasatospora cineracea]|uniref:hypothetical protein n=1 Tax=Kitasatospora cineracea TaxID=88074 RepID=UPI00340600AB
MPPLIPETYTVEGLEQGGLDLIHQPCQALVAGGGCTCCEGQAVTLAQLLNAAEAHLCPIPNAQLHQGN